MVRSHTTPLCGNQWEDERKGDDETEQMVFPVP